MVVRSLPAQKESIYTGVRNLRIVSSWRRTRVFCLQALGHREWGGNRGIKDCESLTDSTGYKRTKEINIAPWLKGKRHIYMQYIDMDAIQDIRLGV